MPWIVGFYLVGGAFWLVVSLICTLIQTYEYRDELKKSWRHVEDEDLINARRWYLVFITTLCLTPIWPLALIAVAWLGVRQVYRFTNTALQAELAHLFPPKVDR